MESKPHTSGASGIGTGGFGIMPRNKIFQAIPAVVVLASVTTAHADIYNYSCKVGQQSYPLIVDDVKKTLQWQGTTYEGVTNANEDEIRCAKSGWHVENGERSFNFCNATQGYAGIEKEDGKVETECRFQNVVDSSPPPALPRRDDPVGNWLDKLAARQKATADANKPSPPAAQVYENKTLESLADKRADTPNQKAEELSCNSDTVKQILVDGTIGRTLGYVEQYKRHANANSPAGIALEQVSHWRGTVANVRETDRTSASVSCAAEFEWSNMPSRDSLQMVGMILMTEGIKDPSCIKINYRVQPLLDKPGQVYVSWRCNDG